MAAIGTKPTCCGHPAMSAFGLKPSRHSSDRGAQKFESDRGRGCKQGSDTKSDSPERNGSRPSVMIPSVSRAVRVPRPIMDTAHTTHTTILRILIIDF